MERTPRDWWPIKPWWTCNFRELCIDESMNLQIVRNHSSYSLTIVDQPIGISLKPLSGDCKIRCYVSPGLDDRPGHRRQPCSRRSRWRVTAKRHCVIGFLQSRGIPPSHWWLVVTSIYGQSELLHWDPDWWTVWILSNAQVQLEKLAHPLSLVDRWLLCPKIHVIVPILHACTHK